MPANIFYWTPNTSQWTELGGAVTSSTNYPAAVVPNGVTVVDYASIAQSGDTFVQALNRLASPAIVKLPAGLYELIDFDATTHYSCYAPNCLGLWGAGVDKTVIQLRPGSSTQVSLVPPQSSAPATNPLMMVRLSKQHILTQNLTIAGTDQPTDPNTGLPHIYNGWVHYMTGGSNSGPNVGSQLYNVKITGVPGNENSPPGETMADTGYIDTNTVEVGVEVDGYTWVYENTVQADGTLKRTKGSHYGGGARGHYGSHNVTEYGANYHDGLVSGPTYSFHGVPTDYSATTQGVTTYDVKSIRNANWTLGGGQKFSGFNMENTYGPIRHIRPFITLTDLAVTQWDAAHMAINSRLGDNPDIQIIDPVWTNGYYKFNGMFTISTAATYAGVTQTQTTAPTIILNGNTLQPIRLTSNPSGVLTQYSPDKYYVWTSP